jgi:hypothetical protein
MDNPVFRKRFFVLKIFENIPRKPDRWRKTRSNNELHFKAVHPDHESSETPEKYYMFPGQT